VSSPLCRTALWARFRQADDNGGIALVGAAHLGQPIDKVYVGLRSDKPAEQVRREVVRP